MARPIENTERVTTFITKEQLAEIQTFARSKGTTVSGYIRMLIAEDIANAHLNGMDSNLKDKESLRKLLNTLLTSID